MKARNSLLGILMLLNASASFAAHVLPEGVLINSSPSSRSFHWVDLNGGLKVYGDDKRLYGEFVANRKDHEVRFLRGGRRVRPVVRAYEPDYNILIIDATPLSDGAFRVNLDGKSAKIMSANGLTYKPWAQFLVENGKVIPRSGKKVRLYQTKAGTGQVTLDNPEDYSFNILRVDGGWVYISCDADCEGCGRTGSALNGWVRIEEIGDGEWELRYIC